MRFRVLSVMGLCLGWLCLAGNQGYAQDHGPTEYQIKAAFLFNFAKFVEWPARCFADAHAPLVIGILGENPFQDDLAQTIRGKSIDEHPLQVREFRSASAATNCHILFISTSEKKRLPEVLDTLKRASVLTVGEMNNFAESGGMINFVLAGTKIRFQINQDAARKAGLKVSAKLMGLAWHPGQAG